MYIYINKCVCVWVPWAMATKQFKKYTYENGATIKKLTLPIRSA